MLEGVTVCPGVAIGTVRLRGYELDRPMPQRIPSARIEAEIERFARALERSRQQVDDLQRRLEGELGAEEGRILEVHKAYLLDAAFRKDVENRIRSDQLQLEDALVKIVRDFDRIFELVESPHMKERALDLRDVALRVIRNLDGETAAQEAASEPGARYVLCAQKLSIADMFHLDHQQVLGIIAEAGGVDSHAAILARSMRIPTVGGVGPLRDRLREGDFVIVDASTGVVHVNPDERVRREYAARAGAERVETPFDQAGPAELGDGTRVVLLGSCGNLGEVSQVVEAGLDGVGVYRTELLFLIDRAAPGEDLLVRHYGEVLERAQDKQVSFRLLDLTRDQHVAGLRAQAEPNPALGLKGVRLLLRETVLLRLQVRALLRLRPGGAVRVVVPFVTSSQDLSRVKEVVRAERAALLKAGVPCVDRIELGAMVEVPSVAFHLTGVVGEADFLVVALDGLQQYLLAADRDNAAVGDYHRTFHPALFHALRGLAGQASSAGVEITLFGEAAADPLRLPFYVGVGYKRLSVSPVRAPRVRTALAAWTEAAARDLAARVLDAEASLEVQRILLESER